MCSRLLTRLGSFGGTLYWSLVSQSQDVLLTLSMPDPAWGLSKPHTFSEGINVLITSLVLVAELAGGGMVALPHAVQLIGVFGGVIALLSLALICGYSGVILGSCWLLLQRRWPEYREHCNRPYQQIGRRAVGGAIVPLVSLCINLSLFGSCVALLILAACNLHNLLSALGLNVSACILMIFIALLILPLTFLGSPKDFWPAMVAGVGCSTVAAIIILVGILFDWKDREIVGNSKPLGTEQTFVSFGLIVFAYTGHSAFPTIQQDMKKPSRWYKAVAVAFFVQLMYYMPLSVLGSVVYGSRVKSNIIENLSNGICRFLTSVFVTIDVTLGIILMINPVCQEMEHFCSMPNEFGYKRVILRSSVLGAVLLVAETVPNFGPLLSLVGGSVVTLLALVFPPVFYYFLMRQTPQYKHVAVWLPEGNDEDLIYSEEIDGGLAVPWYIFISLAFMIALGIAGSVGCTYTNLNSLMHSANISVLPCYIPVINTTVLE